MIRAAYRNPTPPDGKHEVIFHHRNSVLVTLVCLLSGLLVLFVLVLFVFAAVFGPGFDRDSQDLAWAVFIRGCLLVILIPFVWLLWRKPAVLIVGDARIHLPIAFKRPLRWNEIHRVRLLQPGQSFYGRRDWVIVDPSPGILAPIRLKSWRTLDLWFQKNHGVRIPLHGLDADPEEVVQAIKVYRPVMRNTK